MTAEKMTIPEARNLLVDHLRDCPLEPRQPGDPVHHGECPEYAGILKALGDAAK